MSLIPWQPLRELDQMRQQMNRLFDELIHTRHSESLFSKKENVTWMPAIELEETDANIIFKAEVPGVSAKNLDVQVSQNAVSIAGEHEEEKRTEDKGFVRSEFRYGKFQRIVPLPVSVKQDQVEAEFKNGLLTLTLPKIQEANSNVVKVDLTIQEKAREAMAESRQHEEHIQQTMHSRAATELEKSTNSYQ
ncbi:Hsp20/alpha crystallin family protein [Aetokthonos hydrillicola Thurmond2011]|jgi:HSP20 family protein|uniref:Hsp20/alpha crystallin family protein n=1 Tax=Aetokthonos hydrillicola Thurmond2011 TaxID=2712845 RepID=A0AAP5IHS4_9CYAN|nr:Hsp20/alpha crystallin family protein [Aetokthonos hydrillicola]MBO3460755.1 Hsp20/alpha crystallin family protein [Aetokthonos hydrillicola CCALA 1050]MBW4586385.1 Hsp20/alpha crystallin family protein [Aetokthonos hydrillicola CCALA 1050]MDR9899910.1 Hsp20/alpha crystallin family protein [Aetokthonos hydrillicola Thurmond2011]